MGRPIKKRWFTVKDSDSGSLVDLALTTSTGVEAIIAQKGSSTYDVGSGRVKLVNKTSSPNAGEAILVVGGEPVSKITQYRMYFFNPTVKDIQWRDGDANILVTLDPAPVPEGGAPVTQTATATASATPDPLAFAIYIIDVDDAGTGYTDGTVGVTVSAPDATDASLGLYDYKTDPDNADGSGSVIISDGGTGYSLVPVVTQSGGTGSGATFTAVVTAGVVTSVVGDGNGTGYDGTETFTIGASLKLLATAEGTSTGGLITDITVTDGGAGYVSAPTITVDAP